MMKKVIIEEGIYDIYSKLPLIRVIFTEDNNKITRSIFILGHSEKRNSKIDVIDFVRVDLSTINNLSALELGEQIKNEVASCFQRNINNELPQFIYPIIKEFFNNEEKQ